MIPCLSSAETQRSPFATLIPSAGFPAHIIGLFKMDYFYSSTRSSAYAVRLMPAMHEIIMQNDRNTLKILVFVRFISVILSFHYFPWVRDSL